MSVQQEKRGSGALRQLAIGVLGATAILILVRVASETNWSREMVTALTRSSLVTGLLGFPLLFGVQVWLCAKARTPIQLGISFLATILVSVGLVSLVVPTLNWLSGSMIAPNAPGDDRGELIAFLGQYFLAVYWRLVAIMGPLEDNGGTETLAVDERALFLCAEADRPAPEPNCYWQTQGMGPRPLRVEPPVDMRGINAVATDADMANDGTLFVLFRSYAPGRGNVAGIVALGGDDFDRDVVTLRPPLTVDNFEGLAVREAAGRTFLYIVSDDNFSGDQRTLLMKFVVEGAPSS